MTLEELKQNIESLTGVPASLLTGETAEENIAQAKALLAYKRGSDAQKPKSAKEQFIDWLNAQADYEQTDATSQALAQIEQAAGKNASVDPCREGKSLSAKDQFISWIEQAGL